MKRLSVFLWLFLLCVYVFSSHVYAQATGFADGDRASTKIVGGYEAQPGAWPWMVGLIRKSAVSVFQGQYCGGALISSGWVLTAAHCVENRTISDFYVIAGVHDLSADSGVRFGVKRIIKHPGFNATTNGYDFALLELAGKAEQMPVPIYSGVSYGVVGSSLTGQISTIIGWGTTSPTGSNYPEKLQQVEVPIVSNSVCDTSYPSQIEDNMICAGYPAGGKDSCSGDSGGPLMVRVDGQWVHAGVVSWGQGCAQPGFYGVNGRSSAVVDFISQYVTDASFVPQLKQIPLGPALFMILLHAHGGDTAD